MEERMLYFDIVNGISGDMTIATLLDLGIPKEVFLWPRHHTLRGPVIMCCLVRKANSERVQVAKCSVAMYKV